MIIDCVSDLHGFYPELEGGDLLIVAGDLTARDSARELMDFVIYVKQSYYKKVIVIAGNHDNSLKYNNEEDCIFDTDHDAHIQYLCDSGTEFEWEETEDTKWGARHLPGCRSLKLKIWGSPWTKSFEGMNPQCKAFTVDTEEELAEKWALIPEDVDILITHSPPFMIHDTTYHGKHVGSPTLYQLYLQPKRPKLHVFGHVHEAYGKHYEGFHFNCDSEEITEWGILSVNASHVNEHYKPVNKPIRIIL